MHRFLPPLLVVALLGGLVARVAARPSRTPRQVQIASLVHGGNQAAAHAELTRYARDFDDQTDRWFVAEMRLRLGDIDGALDRVWGDASMRNDPATQRRFAIMALEVMGWADRDRAVETQDTPACLLALVEGGVPWAEDILRRKAATDTLIDATRYFFIAFRDTTSGPLRIILEEFRKRDDPQFRVAVAMAAVRDPKTRRPSDVDALRQVVASERWRTQHTDVWRSCAYALGQSGDAQGVEVLRKQLGTLTETEGRTVEDDKAFLRIGLFASGDWTQHEPLFERILDPEHYDRSIASWALQALLHLHHTGDPEARHIVGDVWALPGERFPGLRHTIVRSILLPEGDPDEKAIPVAMVLRDLQDEGAPLISHVLARAYLLRRGQPDGQETVLAALRQAGKLLRVPGADPAVLHEAVREGLRALLLYPAKTP